MARTKQREQHGSGSVSAVMSTKKDGTKAQAHDKQGRPTWRICLTLGTEEYVNESGQLRRRQRKIQKTFHGSLREARSYRDRLAKQYKKASAEHTRETFSALCQAWSTSEDVGCSDKQLQQYMRLLGYCAPYLDKKPLAELTKRDVSDALSKASVRQDGTAMAPSSVSKMKTVVRRVLGWGVDEEWLASDPSPRKRRQRYGTGQQENIQHRRSLSAEEAAWLCRCLDESEEKAYAELQAKEMRQAENGNSFGRSSILHLGNLSNILAVRLMLATGMRRGEALGMTWANVDLDNGTVRVAQTLNESMEMRKPKTDNGNRNLYVDSHTLEHLRRWKAFQAKMLHLICVDGVAMTQDSSTPVFITDNGTWTDPTNLYRWWSDYRSHAGCDGLTLHELRHTAITLLAANGIPLSMIQERVGHSRPSSVTSIYLHELPAADHEAAEVMGRILYESTAERGTVERLQKTA